MADELPQLVVSLDRHHHTEARLLPRRSPAIAGGRRRGARRQGEIPAVAGGAELGLRFHQELVACRADGARTALYATLLCTVGVAVAAVLLYRWLPRWRQRKDRLPELYSAQRIAAAVEGGSGDDERLAHLARLVRRAKLPRDRLPGFVCNPRALSAGAVTFGSVGRYTACLNVGLLPKRTTEDRAHFDAVVLHELAHVRDRDVDLAYLAVALWRVFLTAVLLPCLALNAALVLHDRFQGIERAYWDGYEPGAKTALLAVVLTALVYVARADILRHRELVADRDAVFESGSDREVWSNQAESRSAASPRLRLPRFLRNHPTWSERLAEMVQRGMLTAREMTVSKVRSGRIRRRAMRGRAPKPVT
ncbi:M48 family metalloprotease [Streptomyces niveus]|uniref:M48 family metalloprotease n=1 Tax=Streptomyces niveus TaxID=193462 RepID=UPI0033DA4BD3